MLHVATRPTDADLDSLLTDAETRAAEHRHVASARRRLATDLSPADRTELEATVARHDDVYLWETVAHVALVHAQTCVTCGTVHELFMGWMREQQHRVIPGTRRLLAGRTTANVPLRIERHQQRPVDVCAACLPAYLAAQRALGVPTGGLA